MADDKQTSTAKQILLQKIYIKDLSFESPRAPEVFKDKLAPQTQLSIKSAAKELAPDTQEVTLTVTVEAKDEDKVLFLVELQQAGVFLVQGYTEQERHMLVGSYCPGTLYPFAREAIADMVTRGGFPQFLLQPINFDVLYAQAVRESASGDGEQTFGGEAPRETH